MSLKHPVFMALFHKLCAVNGYPKSHRYRITDDSWRTLLFCSRSYHRLLRPGLAQILPDEATPGTTLRRRLEQLDAGIDQWLEEHQMAA